MAELKLAKLPDRTPVKLAITITRPARRLALTCRRLCGGLWLRRAVFFLLIPAMLAALFDRDRAFVRAREAVQRGWA
jgi:hypothetical protein